MKLEYDTPPSNFAFKFNLRPYTSVFDYIWSAVKPLLAAHTQSKIRIFQTGPEQYKVRRCRLTPCSPRVDCTWFQLLKLIFDRQIANFACNFNLRRYIKVINSVASFNYPELSKAIYILNSPSVRRCRLTPG